MSDYFAFNYPVTAYGGLIYPWGYRIQKFLTTLSAGPFKGPYTMLFTPSAVDTSVFSVTKIVYDFGDNSEIVVIEKDIVPNILGTFQWDGNPASVNISHTYYPLNNNATTYYPSVTVFNGDLSQNIFKIQFTMYPLSLYEYSSFRMVNALQPNITKNETLGIFEVEDPTFVTNAKLLSAPDTEYGYPYETLPNLIGGLNLWLDAADALTIDKNSSDLVSIWRDKSGYGNDFVQLSANNRPLFLYDSETDTTRKSVKFTASSAYGDVNAKFLQCTRTDTLSSVSSGYTALFVLAPKEQQGIIIGKSASIFSRKFIFNMLSDNNAVYITNGNVNSTAKVENISQILSAYSLFTVTINDNDTKITADNLIFNVTPATSYNFTPNNAKMSISTEQYNQSQINSGALTNTEISEILMYNRPLSQNELNKLRDYLKIKWQITYQTI